MATKDEIIDAISKMTVLEVADLIKAMEDKFGVKAAAAAAAPAAGAAPAAAAAEPTEFDVILKSSDPAKKIPAIKAIRALMGVGLGDAKKIAEEGNKTVKENVSKADAEAAKKALEEAGCVVEVKAAE